MNLAKELAATLTAAVEQAHAHAGVRVARMDLVSRAAATGEGPAMTVTDGQRLVLAHGYGVAGPAWGRDIRTNDRAKNHQSVTAVTIRRRERRRANQVGARR